jgi:hypothetical protein
MSRFPKHARPNLSHKAPLDNAQVSSVRHKGMLPFQREEDFFAHNNSARASTGQDWL